MKALDACAGSAALLPLEQGPSIRRRPAIARPRNAAGAALLAALLGSAASLEGCAGPPPATAPIPRVGSTLPTERLPIDGLWAVAGDPEVFVQLDRGRLYLQSVSGSTSRHGELLYADIHQSSPKAYRCRQPISSQTGIEWRPCRLKLREDGRLRARAAESDAAPAHKQTFERIALADEMWSDAQAAAWHLVSQRAAHRPPPETPVLAATAPVPRLPPAPSAHAPAYSVPSLAARFGRYRALVIGTGDYAYLPAVATAEADADAVSELLREHYGFDVTDLRNPSLAEFSAALRRYEQELGEQDNLLIYYAGHGLLSEELGRCYWFPADAMEADPSQGIANDSLVAAVGSMRAKHVLIVADSCFTALERREAGLDQEEGDVHDRLSRLRARVVLTSGGPEPIQDGDGGDHSVFTGALLGVLGANREILDGTSLYQEIQQLVSSASESPEYADIRGADHEGGDFLFVPLP